MKKEVDIAEIYAEIIANNPQIDPQELQDSMGMLEKLQDLGVAKREYQLVPIFGGRRAHVADNAEDSRMVHLNRPK